MGEQGLCSSGLSWKGEPEEDHPGRGEQERNPHVFLDGGISFEGLGYTTPHPENILKRRNSTSTMCC